MTFGEKLKIIRTQRKMSQQSMADLLGTSKQVISRYELGQNTPKISVAAKWCKILGVDIENMLNDQKGIYEDSTPPLPPDILPLPVTVRKPRLGSIACGEPILAQENVECYDEVPADIHCDFTLLCRGDSMINARIFDGDIVYIRQQEEVENGEIAAVLIEDEATLKRVQLFGDHIVLLPENPLYKPLVYWNEDMNAVRILGKAVYFMSSVR